MIDSNGWLNNARHVPSPNFNERPQACAVDLLVIHNISLPPGQFGGGHVAQLFTNCLNPEEHDYFADIARLQVSAHFLIDRCGELTQFVPLHSRAWHAGSSTFAGRANCNDFSVGIELEGSDHVPYTEEQYQQLAEVTRQIMSIFPSITLDRIVGHSDIAPDRKTDPGPAFDWHKYKGLVGPGKG